MRLAAAIVFFVFLCGTFTSVNAQQGAVEQEAVTTSAAQSPVADASQSNGELRTDVEKMRVIVQQMEANLAFVDTTQSPLKHQFELEIRMWKMVIAHMDRKLNGTKPQ